MLQLLYGTLRLVHYSAYGPQVMVDLGGGWNPFDQMFLGDWLIQEPRQIVIVALLV